MTEVELEYEQQTDTLVIHQYDIKGPKEEVRVYYYNYYYYFTVINIPSFVKNKNNWQESQHLVFQKLNLLAKSAFEDVLVFYARESLYSLLVKQSVNHHSLWIDWTHYIVLGMDWKLS